MLTVRAVDAIVQLVYPDFSISRLITRVLGHKLITLLLTRQARMLQLPPHLRAGIDSALAGFGNDNKAHVWVNKVEDWMTTQSGWDTHLPASLAPVRTRVQK